MSEAPAHCRTHISANNMFLSPREMLFHSRRHNGEKSMLVMWDKSGPKPIYQLLFHVFFSFLFVSVSVSLSFKFKKIQFKSKKLYRQAKQKLTLQKQVKIEAKFTVSLSLSLFCLSESLTG